MTQDPPRPDRPYIVVIGRTNPARTSQSLAQMVAALGAEGFGLHRFEPRHAQRARRFRRWFQSLGAGAVAAFCRAHPGPGRPLERLAKAAWIVAHPRWWDWGLLQPVSKNERAARNLRALLRRWQRRFPARPVHLLGHSAGGIIASLVAGEPNVASLTCFGYPFRHPEKGDEPERTMHLPSVAKPFLIVQGHGDVYGTAAQAMAYRLAPTIRLHPVAANHDYDDLPPEVLADCLAQLAAHVGATRHGARAGAAHP